MPRAEVGHSFVEANYPPALRERIWQTIRRMREEIAAADGASYPNGNATAILAPARYCACYRSSGRLVDVLLAPGLMRRETRGQFTKAEHDRAARAWMAEAVEAGKLWDQLVTCARNAYGDHGPLISGVYRDHFPADVKDELRTLARLRTFALDASVAHWIGGSGRRIATWRREWEGLQAVTGR